MSAEPSHASGDPDTQRQDPLTSPTDALREGLTDLSAALEAAEPLRRIELLQAIRGLIEADLLATVLQAHSGGASWASIGAAAGITRQAAHERWRSLTAAPASDPDSPSDPSTGDDGVRDPDTHGDDANDGVSVGGDDGKAPRTRGAIQPRQRRERLRIAVGGLTLPVSVELTRTTLPPASPARRPRSRRSSAS